MLCSAHTDIRACAIVGASNADPTEVNLPTEDYTAAVNCEPTVLAITYVPTTLFTEGHGNNADLQTAVQTGLNTLPAGSKKQFFRG